MASQKPPKKNIASPQINIRDEYERNHVPVVIGNYAPFRLVLREGDSWEPTLEQINSRTFDYVKLSRLSCFIDIGIAPFSLGIGLTEV